MTPGFNSDVRSEQTLYKGRGIYNLYSLA